MIRRVGDVPERGRSYRLRPGAYVILPLHGQLLLTHQSEPEPEFQLPGGGIDPGESALQALHREVLEETGWRISAPRRLGAHRRFVFMPEYDLYAEKLCHVYVARPARRLGPPSEAFHQDIWMDPDQAIELVANDGDRHFLQQVFY